jgi:hypothetical protein
VQISLFGKYSLIICGDVLSIVNVQQDDPNEVTDLCERKKYNFHTIQESVDHCALFYSFS